jgi:hypothetical protein
MIKKLITIILMTTLLTVGAVGIICSMIYVVDQRRVVAVEQNYTAKIAEMEEAHSEALNDAYDINKSLDRAIAGLRPDGNITRFVTIGQSTYKVTITNTR